MGSSSPSRLSQPLRLDFVPSATWEFVAPNPALAPRFHQAASPALLVAEGNGREECYGYARCPVRLAGGRSYFLRVRLQAEGMRSPEHHTVHGLFGASYSGGIFSLRAEKKGYYVGEQRFHGPLEDLDVELRVYFRYSPHGRVTWNEIFLEERDPIPPRPATFICREGAQASGASLAYWEEWLDRAGERHPDLALLPETFDGAGPAAANSPGGPPAQLLAAKSRQWNMYTCGSYFEARHDLVYNTAPLFDRRGHLVGSYDKILPFEQELDLGVSPGRELRTFDTDFGCVAVMTCFDSWFPEVARTLVRMGAEVILLPNAGYYEDLMPARAADNNVCIAASSLYHSAGLWESSGARAGGQSAESREAPNAILTFERDPEHGLLLATVDLSKKYSPHWKGGPMSSAPALRGSRVTSLRLLR
jgi:predicted amidohydrolase